MRIKRAEASTLFWGERERRRKKDIFRWEDDKGKENRLNTEEGP